jgi:hypothetical protein
LYNVFHQIYTIFNNIITMPQVELKEGPLEQFTHHTWDGALSTEARTSSSLEQRFVASPALHKCFKSATKNVIKKTAIVGAGVVELVDHVVCEEGKPLSPEATWLCMKYYAMVVICLI